METFFYSFYVFRVVREGGGKGKWGGCGKWRGKGEGGKGTRGCLYLGRK